MMHRQAGRKRKIQLPHDEDPKTTDMRVASRILAEIPQCAMNAMVAKDSNTSTVEPMKQRIKSTIEKKPVPILKPRSLMLQTSVQRRLKRRKKVQFDEGTKFWDGIEDSGQRDLDDLLFRFLFSRKEIGDTHILKWTQRNAERIRVMSRLLSKLCGKLVKSSDGKMIPCLPRGGGKSLRVHKDDLPYLKSLLTVLDSALEMARDH